MSRYEAMFAEVNQEERIAFIPFVTLGDPNVETSLAIIDALVAGGADALELGFPFSDPIADGPTIQKASKRALDSGVTIADCFEILKRVRASYPSLPIGLLLYSNLVFKPSLDQFYQRLSDVGVDSVLIADVPLVEIDPFIASAKENGIEQVLILPPDADQDKIMAVAHRSQGYVYLLSRSGVTGTETEADVPKDAIIAALQEAGSAPPVLGFGISEPSQVSATKASGASGAISGSAVVKLIENNLDNSETMLSSLTEFVKAMKAAT